MTEKPIRRLPSASIKDIASRREAVCDDLFDYLATDLVCYRTSHPPALAELQTRLWDPVLDSIKTRYGSRPAITTGLMAIEPAPELVRAIKQDIEALDETRFGVLYMATTLIGSVLIGLLLVHGDMTAADAIEAHFCDEEFYDALARKETDNRDPLLVKKRALLVKDLDSALALLRSAPFK